MNFSKGLQSAVSWKYISTFADLTWENMVVVKERRNIIWRCCFSSCCHLLFFCLLVIRPEFYKHIVLSGGSTMYPGLPSRLERELKQLYLERVLKGDVDKLSVRHEHLIHIMLLYMWRAFAEELWAKTVQMWFAVWLWLRDQVAQHWFF